MIKYKFDVSKVKRLMFEHDITKKDLAAATGMSESQTYRMLNGTVSPKATTICAIAGLLEQNPGVLFADVDEMPVARPARRLATRSTTNE